MKDTAVIILAGGRGERFGGEKQFVKIHGKSILSHTIDTWLSFNIAMPIIVVVPQKKINFMKNHYKNIKHLIFTCGSNSRLESTKQGLEYLHNNFISRKYVYIHDAVRPIITKKLCLSLYDKVHTDEYSGAVPYLHVSDSIISFNNGKMEKNRYLDRARLAKLQTPHIYHCGDLWQTLSGYKGPELENAQIMEKYKKKIGYVLGIKENVKLTHKEDLVFMAKLLNK